jgi:hypothetical protein
MAKPNNRPGFGALDGSASPLTIVSTIAPQLPKTNTIWLNSRTGEKKYWDGSAWQISGVVNQKTGLRVELSILSAAEYAAIVTKDDDTLYFVYA